MQWSLADLAAATRGEILAAETAPGVDGTLRLGRVSIDSRRVLPGDLFVPLVAERDGHAFLQDAVNAGAGAYLVEAGHTDAAARPRSVPAIGVADTAAALLDLGRAARSRLTGPVVGITGSVGKTSTKDMAAATVGAARRVVASEGSFNNELGVPLTLANAPEDSEVALVEMGARGPGHLVLLCDVARPTIGVVTSVAAAHTEMFGSLEAVAAAKAELVAALPASGRAILNADDPRVAAMARLSSAPVLRYSGGSGAPDLAADVVATGVVVDDDLRARFVLRSPWGSALVHLGVRGSHQVGNALAASAIALLCDVPVDAVAEALGSAALSPWRMQLERAPGGAAVLNDAYNANPTSMAASLRALATLPAARRVAVLGEMAELGPSSGAAHRAIAGLAESLGVAVVAVGTSAYGWPPVAGVEEAVAAVGTLGPHDAVLVKGSRVAGLERVAEALLSQAPIREAPHER
ncbi:MAG: UDP-N-acetylmuramoyl-tripeptide--D-alanyl-D-alanine ligase [Acidimicrobiales bacterium]